MELVRLTNCLMDSKRGSFVYFFCEAAPSLVGVLGTAFESGVACSVMVDRKIFREEVGGEHNGQPPVMGERQAGKETRGNSRYGNGKKEGRLNLRYDSGRMDGGERKRCERPKDHSTCR